MMARERNRDAGLVNDKTSWIKRPVSFIIAPAPSAVCYLLNKTHILELYLQLPIVFFDDRDNGKP